MKIEKAEMLSFPYFWCHGCDKAFSNKLTILVNLTFNHGPAGGHSLWLRLCENCILELGEAREKFTRNDLH